jgi:ABC-2 type transport system permease protein
MKKITALVFVELKKLYRDPMTLAVLLLMPVGLTLVYYIALGNVGNDYYPPGIDSHFEYLLPGTMGYAVIYMAMMVALALCEYRQDGLLKRIKVTPVTPGQHMGSLILANMVIAVAQSLIVLLLAWILGFDPQGGLLGLLLVVVFLGLLAVTSVGLGLLTATVAKNTGAASGLSMIYLIPMMVFGTFLAVFNDMTRTIARFTPNYYVTDALIRIFTGTSLTNRIIWQDMLILAIISVVVVVAGTQLFKKVGYR